MHARKLLLFTLLITLPAPASASAYFGHVVGAGESLSSVAATDGLSVSQLAAANGISPDSQLIAGSTLQIPPQSAGPNPPPAPTSSAPAQASSASSTDTAASSQVSSSPSSVSSSGSGGYTVQPGDTLSAIAVRYGTTVDQLAATNGLEASGILPAGITLSVGGGSTSSADSSSAAPESTSTTASASESGSSGSGGAQPTAERVSSSQVGQVAAANGVSPSLAEAIGYQESGFNNNLVSSTGATGVMQIEPATWDYIDSYLATPPPLSRTSAQDNVRGGVLLLHSLLNQTGGDPMLAAAGYYQGLTSLRQHGMYSDTQQYVNNVMALRHRFGGP
jgi:N-acetylmuramoyl-L-alanine amidase